MKSRKYFFSSLLVASVAITGCGNTGSESGLSKKATNQDKAFDNQASTEKKLTTTKVVDPMRLGLKLTPFVADFQGAPEASLLLKNRINSAIAKVGYGGEGGNPRFILGPNISLLSQNLTGTAPTIYANTYEMNFMVVDVVTETVFASYSIEAKGVGDSPEKAFISALRNVDLQNSSFNNFLAEAENKVIDFFEQNCSKMLAEAQASAGMRNFEEAYSILNSVPPDATSCFTEIQGKKQEYFQLTLNLNCAELLNKMRAELGKFNDASASGFNAEAMGYYALIDKQSDCYSDAQKEYDKYVSKLNPKAKRDWEMEQRRYEDEIEMTKQDRAAKRDSMKYAMIHDEKMAEIKAKADIEGNKKLLAKYKHDESPWLIRVFSSGSKLFKGEMDTN